MFSIFAYHIYNIKYKKLIQFLIYNLLSIVLAIISYEILLVNEAKYTLSNIKVNSGSLK